MSARKLTDAEFIAAWKKYGSPSLMSRMVDLDRSNICKIRAKLIEKGVELPLHNAQRPEVMKKKNPARHQLELKDGMAIVFSDAHYYPGEATTAHKALLLFIKQFHPEIVVCNGDAFDGATISRHPRIGWDSKPTVKEEIAAVKERLGEIEDMSKGKLIWTLGNHCARFETFLAANAPQYEGLSGFTLKDHFPRWIPTWSLFLNNEVCIKHRWKGGIHATHNNTVGSGLSMVTGHLHSLKVTPYSDYTGTRYGVDTGTLAVPYGEQFVDYTEDNPVNWRSGFAVLTFKGGKMLPPELVHVWDEDEGVVCFRGAFINV
jgi:hypothetical protein